MQKDIIIPNMSCTDICHFPAHSYILITCFDVNSDSDVFCVGMQFYAAEIQPVLATSFSKEHLE